MKSCKSRTRKTTADLFRIRWHIGICGLKRSRRVACIKCNERFIIDGEMNEGEFYRRY